MLRAVPCKAFLPSLPLHRRCTGYSAQYPVLLLAFLLQSQKDVQSPDITFFATPYCKALLPSDAKLVPRKDVVAKHLGTSFARTGELAFPVQLQEGVAKNVMSGLCTWFILVECVSGVHRKGFARLVTVHFPPTENFLRY